MPPELVVILYLVVRDLHVLHGQQSQLLSSLRVAAVLHVPRDREQLGRGHGLGCSVDDDLVGRLERDRLVLTEGQSAQGTVGRILQCSNLIFSDLSKGDLLFRLKNTLSCKLETIFFISNYFLSQKVRETCRGLSQFLDVRFRVSKRDRFGKV